MLDIETKVKINELKARYPQPRSALMPALYVIQNRYGTITKEHVEDLAFEFEMQPIQIQEVVSFYTMYKTKPSGIYHIRICRTLSCAISGANTLKDYLWEKLDLNEKEVSADGLWSFETVECLGACDKAPVIQINDTLFEKMTPEKLAQLLDKIAAERPNLSLSFEDL